MMVRTQVLSSVAMFILFQLSGCAKIPLPAEIDLMIQRAMLASREQVVAGRHEESMQLLSAVQRVDANYPGLASAMEESRGSQIGDLFDHPFLGSNFARRVPCERPTWAKILLYLPDRALDLADVISFDLHLGIGAYFNIHYTRALQLGAGAETVGGLGWHDHRSLGVLGRAQSDLVLPALGTQAYTASVIGTSGIRTCSDSLFGFHRPSNFIYQVDRDYWAVGYSIHALFVGFDFDWHPVEIADFIAGLSTYDFLHDDFAGTRGLELETADQELIWELIAISRSDEALANYRASRGIGSR